VIGKENLEEIEANPSPLVKLSQVSSIHYLNGVLFGQYLLTIKRVMKRQENQILNIKVDSINGMHQGMNVESRRQNWNTIAGELDKIGINIDEDAIGEIVEGV
jgi:hypothetical protein